MAARAGVGRLRTAVGTVGCWWLPGEDTALCARAGVASPLGREETLALGYLFSFFNLNLKIIIHAYLPPPPPPLATTSLFSVSMDLVYIPTFRSHTDER